MDEAHHLVQGGDEVPEIDIELAVERILDESRGQAFEVKGQPTGDGVLNYILEATAQDSGRSGQAVICEGDCLIRFLVQFVHLAPLR